MRMRISCLGMAAAAVLLTCALILPGCSTTPSAPPPNPAGQAPPSGGAPVASTPSGPRPTFYDFQDIPTPNELDLLGKESYVFQSGPLKAGVLTLRGRVDLNSLINFFQMAMPRENWKPKGGFRYRRSVLIFEKPDRVCVIQFYEKWLYSYVEIYVAPAGGPV